ncbi:MAG: family 10 glycosylhydrolase [Planctomycetaceae bacterium]|nr:family 10 glycosylhydrolase [Planctomycetaceae bacterium]
MFGHGCPIAVPWLIARSRDLGWGALWLLCFLTTTIVSAETVRVRLRVEWGGSAERIWQGSINLSQGRLFNVAPLGLEADESATFWNDTQRITVQGRSGRTYDGLDVSIEAPREAMLRIELAGLDDNKPPSPIDVPLTSVIDESHNGSLDPLGTRLLVRRAPGDKLRVQFYRDHLIFTPGEVWHVAVEPALSGMTAGSKLRLQSRLVGSDNAQVWSDDREWTAPAEGAAQTPLTLAVTMPQQEGVYDLVLQASRRTITDRIGLRNATEERRVQLIVVAPQKPVLRSEPQPPTFDVLAEIDPAQAAWWDRFAAWPASLPRLPNMRRGPLGNGQLNTFEHPLGKLARLSAVARDADLPWEAYPLPITRLGQPHIVEVEYPTDVAQTLGFSIVEPNAAGAVIPIGLDSGLYLPPEASEQTPTIERHRLIFWPRTNSPLLLVTNRRPGQSAVYGKIRLLGQKQSAWPTLQRLPEPPAPLPRSPIAGNVQSGRQWLVYYDRPLFAENFGAPQAVDVNSAHTGRTLHDWHTFETGSRRLTEYLNHVGYSGAIVSVLADGASLYPSRIIEPTSRHDDGAFFSMGQDPLRKDVVELLMRHCDREGLRLIPAVQFAAPLKLLEQRIRAGGPQAQGIELVGVDGQPWRATHAARQGLGPYYNPLHPQVQEAMLAVIAELVDRYSPHGSFGGVAIQMTADGYAQFPGIEWGLDALTLARFEQESGISLAAHRSQTDRAAAVLAEHRPRWLAWRSQQLALWYQRASEYVATRKPGAKLHLLPGDLLNRVELDRELRPALPRTTTIDQLWAAVGVDPAILRALPHVTLMRPERESPVNSVTGSAIDLEFNAATEWDQQFVDVDEPAWLFFHPPLESRLPSFDQKSPFKKTNLRLVTEASPAGARNRQRFAHALAKHDTTLLADGGWLVPLGQEDELRDLVASYRSLPATRFETLAPATPPVTIRTFADEQRSYLYLVNDSPWKATVTLSVEAPEGCRLDPLGAPRRFPPLQGDGERRWWTIDLAPYDVVTGVFSSPLARVTNPTIRLPNQASEWLDARIAELWARAATLSNPTLPQLVTNTDFELSPVGTLTPSDWEIDPRAGSQVKLDDQQRHGGRYSAHITAGTFGAELRSRPFAVPATGRLSLSVWLRVSDAEQPNVIRVGVQSESQGRTWSRAATLGKIAGAQPLNAAWTQYLLEVPELPSDSLANLRVVVELIGTGEAWVDDIELLDLDFKEPERLELSKIITTIEYQRKAGDLAECLRSLEGYWPRYLRAHVPEGDQALARTLIKSVSTTPPQPAAANTPPAAPRNPEAEKRPSMLDRMKRFLPRWSR